MGLHSTSSRSGLRDTNPTHMNGKCRATLQEEFVIITPSIGARVDASKAICNEQNIRGVRTLSCGTCNRKTQHLTEIELALETTQARLLEVFGHDF